MEKYRFIFTVLFAIVEGLCMAQNSATYQVAFEDKREWDVADSGIVQLMRHTHTGTIYFGLYYETDTIAVIKNDSCVFNSMVISDASTGRSSTNITIDLVESNLIKIVFPDCEILFPYDPRFLFLRVDKHDGKIRLVYSNNPPRSK